MGDDSGTFAAHRRTAGGISFTDVGEGPVTLFVHGVFTNGRLWRNCVRLLSDHRRCVTVDLPGHGHTPPVGEPSVWGLADAVGAVIRELDLRGVHLVGNDTGGAVAQVVLTREPERFASFALTNCDTEGNFPPPAFRPAVWAARAGLLRAGAPLARLPKLAKQLYRTGYQNVSAVPDDVITDYLTPILGNPGGARFMAALLSSMTPGQLAPIRPLLGACEVPTAIVWGTGDIFFHRSWADWLVDLIPGATGVVEVPGARLFFPDERARELVDALEDHWKR
ncbi:alpha/beta fold hydrolase [Actinokineospora spheciospongiae]|uniref:alpha/beta fold hydrolase n=1 Tax=Actinokineospora spheciospongiae TaxID=909613 RepID=UPI000D71BCBE|nr:alpha/beta hydrolase [Actinokineospora spheciospongiae]PWW63239.1 pimeloyl-ACP methyl ester carboxylesterase [Actinokineospora spheciospongiae]